MFSFLWEDAHDIFFLPHPTKNCDSHLYFLSHFWKDSCIPAYSLLQMQTLLLTLLISPWNWKQGSLEMIWAPGLRRNHGFLHSAQGRFHCRQLCACRGGLHGPGCLTHEAHSLQRGTDHIWADKQPFMKEDEKHTVLKIVFVFLVHVKQKEWPVWMEAVN